MKRSASPEAEEANKRLRGADGEAIPIESAPKENPPSDENGTNVAAYTRPASVREEEVAISARIAPESFRPGCTLKGRYTDFVVREVARSGEVARLASLELPSDILADFAPKPAAPTTPDVPGGLAALEAFVKETETADVHLDAFRGAVSEAGTFPEGSSVVLTATPLEKQRRGKVHGIIRNFFPGLESGTNGDGFITVANSSGPKPQTRRPRARTREKQSKRYHFTLYKENLETSALVRMLANKLGVHIGAIGYSGTKDKRAVTAQRMSVQLDSPLPLPDLNKGHFGRGICKVGDFCYGEEHLRLGMHAGNRFSIVLRDCMPPPSATSSATVDDFAAFSASVNTTLENVKTNGFINYYGLQRFGSTSIPTFKVAQEMLKGDYVEAMSILLNTKAEIVKEFQEAAGMWTAKPEEAFKLTPYYCGAERQFLERLARLGGYQQIDVRRLFESCYPRNSRSLYFHALQSRVWNEMASIRLTTLPHKVLPGDLVVCETQNPHAKLQQTRHVTAEEAESEKFTLRDIVLPLPGCDVNLMFPAVKGVDREAYETVLKKFNAMELLGGEDFAQESQRNFEPKEYHTWGDYRQVVHTPKDLTWSLTRYEDKEGDLQELEYVHAEKECVLTPGRAIAGFAEPAAPSLEGSRTAIRCSFTLPTSAYATTFLREVFTVTTAAL